MTSTSGLTAEEVTESITGFDEIAVDKHFGGFDLYTDAEAKPVVSLRALVFVHLRHNGMPDKDAHKTVMEMPLKAVHDYFEQDDEANPSDPDTESGKGDSQPETEPAG